MSDADRRVQFVADLAAVLDGDPDALARNVVVRGDNSAIADLEADARAMAGWIGEAGADFVLPEGFSARLCAQAGIAPALAKRSPADSGPQLGGQRDEHPGVRVTLGSQARTGHAGTHPRGDAGETTALALRRADPTPAEGPKRERQKSRTAGRTSLALTAIAALVVAGYYGWQHGGAQFGARPDHTPSAEPRAGSKPQGPRHASGPRAWQVTRYTDPRTRPTRARRSVPKALTQQHPLALPTGVTAAISNGPSRAWLDGGTRLAYDGSDSAALRLSGRALFQREPNRAPKHSRADPLTVVTRAGRFQLQAGLFALTALRGHSQLEVLRGRATAIGLHGEAQTLAMGMAARLDPSGLQTRPIPDPAAGLLLWEAGTHADMGPGKLLSAGRTREASAHELAIRLGPGWARTERVDVFKPEGAHSLELAYQARLPSDAHLLGAFVEDGRGRRAIEARRAGGKVSLNRVRLPAGEALRVGLRYAQRPQARPFGYRYRAELGTASDPNTRLRVVVRTDVATDEPISHHHRVTPDDRGRLTLELDQIAEAGDLVLDFATVKPLPSASLRRNGFATGNDPRASTAAPWVLSLAPGLARRTPRAVHWVVAVDRSQSMFGAPLSTATAFVRALSEALPEDHTMTVLACNASCQQVVGFDGAASRAEALDALVTGVTAGGASDPEGNILEAAATCDRDGTSTCSVVYVGDGWPSLGARIVAPPNEAPRVTPPEGPFLLSTVAIGDQADRTHLSHLAHRQLGHALSLSEARDARGAALRLVYRVGLDDAVHIEAVELSSGENAVRGLPIAIAPGMRGELPLGLGLDPGAPVGVRLRGHRAGKAWSLTTVAATERPLGFAPAPPPVAPPSQVKAPEASGTTETPTEAATGTNATLALPILEGAPQPTLTDPGGSHGSALEALARSLSARGELEQAGRAITRWLARDPSAIPAHRLAMGVDQRRGDRAAARMRAQGLADLAPRDPAIHIAIAGALERTGLPERGCPHRVAASELLPTDRAHITAAVACQRALEDNSQTLARLETRLATLGGPSRANPRPKRPPFVITAAWKGQTRVELILVDTRGDVISSLWLPSEATLVDSPGQQRLQLPAMAPGPYRIELRRALPDPSAVPETIVGTLQLRTRPRTTTLPFALSSQHAWVATLHVTDEGDASPLSQ